MANFTTNLTITTPKETTSATLSGDYTEVFSLSQVLDNNDALISILSNNVTIGSLTLSDCKTLMIKNSGSVGAELNILLNAWTNDPGNADNDTSAQYVSMLLGSGDFIMLPNLRVVGFNASNSCANALELDNAAPNSNMYADISTVSSGFDNTTDPVTIATADGDFWRVGDMIRCNAEVVEITTISGNNLTVKRGMLGTTAASHGDGETLRIQFSNDYADFDKYSTSQTDASGRFKATNFFGYGRYAAQEAAGIVAGSISGKFYSAGYQELGLSGITSSTESGLAASTEYGFDITVDGSGLIDSDDLKFTTSANTKFGGSDGVLRKIQDIFDTLYYTAASGSTGSLIGEKVTVSIVNGDIRFTSGQRLSTSAILLAAPSGGETTPFGVGRMPAIGDVQAAVAARLPDDTIQDRKTGASSPNKGAFFYDDGRGNISGACSGTINYESGAIDLSGCPPNANFVVSANYGAAHAGGNKFEAAYANSIMQIQARSTNAKINTTIDLIGIK